MENDGKKISFGFSKLTKRPNPFLKKPTEEKKVELVECFEAQSIKIKDAVEEVYQPLVIPINDSKKSLLDRVKDAKAKQKLALQKEIKEEVDTRPDSELTLDELAARELLKDAKNRLTQKEAPSKVYELPLGEEKPSFEGEKEPTLEDYESVPISDYGLAMLRGMGWKDGTGIGKNPSKIVTTNEPELRPKGLGLGASKMIKAEKPTEEAVDKDGNKLALIKGSFAKIIAGNHRGEYCEVQGLDDEARVIVKTSIKKEILNLNEYLVVPVTKEEYSKGSKVLNNAKYEDYKEITDRKLEEQRKNLNNKEIKYGSSSKDFSDEDVRKYSSKNSRTHNSSSDSDGSKYNAREKDKSSLKSRRSSSEDKNRSAIPKSRHDSGSDSDNYNSKKERNRHRSRSGSRNRYKCKKERQRSRYRSRSTDSTQRSSSKKEKQRSRHRSSSSEYEKKKVRSRSSSSSDEDYDRRKRKERKNQSRKRSESESSSDDSYYNSKSKSNKERDSYSKKKKKKKSKKSKHKSKR